MSAEKLKILLLLDPDSSSILTRKQAEEELKDFVFRGVGWYFLRDGSAIFVANTFTKGRYEFSFWNTLSFASFRKVINAPVLLNENPESKLHRLLEKIDRRNTEIPPKKEELW